MKNLFLSIVILLTSCISPNQLDKEAVSSEALLVSRTPANYGEVSDDDLISSDDLSFKELVEILKKYRFSKISDLLAHLQSTKSDYMSRYALMFDSRSLHESSKEFPRAIVYGNKANFIITFNGHAKQSGYEMLETVEFNLKSKKFEFREIQFNEFDKQKKPYVVSKVGGPENKCLQCHTNGRPIWEAYPVWPGAYGEDDDFPIGSLSKGSALGMGFRGKYSEEDWNKFQEQYAKVGRYQYLSPLASSKIFGDVYGRRPNSDLSFLLTRLNIKRIGKLIKLKVKPGFRSAYLYAAFCYPIIASDNDSTARENKKLPVHERKPLIFIPEKLNRIVEKFRDKYNPVSLNHQTYRAVQIIKNGFDEREIRERWIKQKENYNEPVPFSADDSLLQATEAMIVSSKGYFMPHKIHHLFLALGALTEKYFPAAQAQTWPSALYEGVFRFDTGSGSEATWLADEVLKNLFSAVEQKKFKEGFDKDDRGYCDQLAQALPAALK